MLSELGIGVTAYGVLSRGLLTGSRPRDPGDFRVRLPRFLGENLERNQRLVKALAALAAEKGTTPARLAIAWALRGGPSIVPVIGARTRAQLDDALGALSLSLSPAELARLDEAIPASAVVGTRYDPVQMQHLDSERP